MTPIKIFIVSMVFLLMHSIASYGGDNFKVAVVDFQRILQNSKLGQQSENEVKQKGEALKSELQKKQEEIKTMQERFKRESPVLSQEIKVQKERELRAELNEFRVMQNQNTQEFNKLRSELINNVRKTVVKLTQEMGKSEGYMLIFEKQSGAVLFAKDSLEITDRFIEDMDEQNEPEKK